MQFFSPVLLSLLPAIAAIVIEAPAEIQPGQEANITWAADSEMLVLYLTEDRDPPLYPIGVAFTADGATTVKYPKVTFDGGYIVAYTREGTGPIGRTGRISIIQE